MTTSTKEDIIQQMRENAERGAAWLDENVPGWADRIDKSILNMGSCYSCIIGQLGGVDINSMLSAETWHEGGEYPASLGFDVPGSAEYYEPGDGYTLLGAYLVLTDAWIEQIDRRRSAVSALS